MTINLDGTTYVQDFDTLANSGTTSDMLPLGWFFFESGTNANDTYGISTGSNNAGNTYSFGATGDSDRAFGTLLSGSLTPTIGASLTNATGSTITGFNIDYFGEQWRLGTSGRAIPDRLDFQYSLNATALSNGTWIDVDALDFVAPVTTGTVGLRDGNAAENRTLVSGTFDGLMVAPGETVWIRWNDFNASGADDGLAVDDFTLVPLLLGVDVRPVVTIVATDANAAEGETPVNTGTFTVTRSGDTTEALTVAYTITGTATNGVDYVELSDTVEILAGQTSATITVTPIDDDLIEGDETVVLTLKAEAEADYDLGAAPSATVTIADNDFDITLISAIQGSGDTSPLVGDVVTVEAIVVGDFQNGDADDSRNLGGFYLQEEDVDADGDASTSEGIFVFQGNFVRDVKIGDKVRVTGTVDEFFGETQIDTITAIEVISEGNELPTAAVISLPAAATTLSQDGRVQPDLEAFEGMRVIFAEELQITEMFQLDRFNEIKLSQGDRPAQFTQNSLPSVEGFATHLQEVGARTITYDDGLSVQNTAITNLDGFANFNTANAPRMGDTIANLEGILSYQWAGNAASGATWRVRAAEDGTNTFEQATPRLATPEPVGGSLKVASFNVLNYFTTIDAPGVSTANGSGPRGADDLTRFGVSPATAEFDRQTDKLVSTILAMDVDVLGLVEVENDFLPGSSGNAIEFLVNELNSVSGAQVYDWVNPGEQFIDASDAISVGVIYQLNAVSLAAGTSVEILRDEDLANLGLDFGQPVFNGPSTSRAPLAVSFQEVATGEVFTVAVNHFKSKGPGGSTGDNVDALDGAGAYNGTRLRSAIALDAWLDTDPTGSGDSDFLILGDLNSYAQEDPIRFLASEGYVDLAQQLIGPDSYSYVFDGQTGTLDYVLASTSLTSQVTGITEWHVNSDEADALDYNLDFGRDPAIFDGTVPYRNSDHDPVIVGLNLSTPKVVITGTPQRDVLVGTERNENFLASGGPDLITTGGGFDCITYTHIDQAGDTITDFEVKVDKLVFTGLLESIGYDGNDPLADVIRIESLGNSDRTRISLELDQLGGGRPQITNFVTLLGVDAAALNNADNFVF